jgi:hypothetical protein
MVKRRKVIVGFGSAGSIAIAGCSSEEPDSNEESSPEEESSSTESNSESDNEQEDTEESEESNEIEEDPSITLEIITENEEGEAINDVGIGISKSGGTFTDDEYITSENTDESGSVIVGDLEPGEYIIEISHSDYKEVSEEIEISDSEEQVTFRLTGTSYSMNEKFVVEEEDLEISVVDTASGETFGPNTADGIFQAVEMEITNVGTDAIDIYHDLFKMTNTENDDVRYDPDSDMSFYLENGISGVFETINPDITKNIQVIFDIPSDIDPIFIINSETEYRVTLQ